MAEVTESNKTLPNKMSSVNTAMRMTSQKSIVGYHGSKNEQDEKSRAIMDTPMNAHLNKDLSHWPTD